MEKLTILAENFRECVRLCQQCVLWAIGTSFSALLIVFQMREIGNAGFAQSQVQVDVLFSHVRLPTAWILASAIYVLLGVYAAYAADQANRNIIELAKDGEGRNMVASAKMYPSLATADYRFLRLAGVVAAPFFMIWSWILEIAREKGSRSWKDEPIVGMIAMALILLLPYVVLLTHLWQPIGASATGEKAQATAAK
jgi:hypothetical protein